MTAWSAERLFEQLFAPLYPPDSELAVLRSTDVNPAGNPRLYQQLDSIADTFAKLAPALIDLDLELDFSDASVHRLGACLTRELRDRLLVPVEGKGEMPPLVQLITHGAIYVGRCIVHNHGATWCMRNPLWESLVELNSRAGVGQLALFQWWLKALSDDEIDEHRLAARYRLHVEVPTRQPGELPTIAPPDRKLPRLTKVRYDTLYKHLRAHLPELKSLGEHFPSAERFAELDFAWLDFELLGDGRMLLLHGPGSKGVHLFWLDLSGYSCSAYFPADPQPAHTVVVDGEVLRVELPVLGAVQTHEMLWSGP